MSDTPLEETVRRLRRRLWIERLLFLLVLLAITGVWAYPLLNPGVWAVYVDGQPVVALRDRDRARAVLEQVKRAGAGSTADVSFVRPVIVARANPAYVEMADFQTAVQRVGAAVQLRAPRGVIYVNGMAVVALPDEAQAKSVLERVKSRYAANLDGLTAAPTFKENVEVRPESADQDAWADADTALGLLTGEGDEPKRHTVVSGDSAWTIAHNYGLTVDALKKLNPSVNLARLHTGDTLSVAKPAEPPLTVVTQGQQTQEAALPFRVQTRPSPKMYAGKREVIQGGKPGRQRVTYRLRSENGQPVAKQVLNHTTLAAPRDQIVVVGTKPRPAGA
jgi:LysM repeat protein